MRHKAQTLDELERNQSKLSDTASKLETTVFLKQVSWVHLIRAVLYPVVDQ